MDLSDLTIKKIIAGYRNKDFSVTEIVKLYLSRIKKYDPSINSFITITEKEAFEEATKKDKLLNNEGVNLPLFGVPVGLKDLFSTKDIKTTAASKVLENYIPPYDATVVKKLKDNGAIILGKLNCDAWAHGSSGENSDFGATKNPWNIEFVPGGSSSGSASAVASSFTTFSTGTDTGGSIRLPASFTNTVGLKPTYGLVSRYGIIAMASSLDSIGHITKTVEDSALVLDVTAGIDKYDATTSCVNVPNYLTNIKNGVKGLRIGIPKEYITKKGGIDSEIVEIYEKAIKLLIKLGAEIVEISLPNTKYAISCYYVIMPSEVSSNLARYDGIRYGKDRSFFGNEAKRRIMLGTYTLSAGYYDSYYKKAMQVRTLIKQDFDQAYKKVDVIITPVSPTLSWKLGEKTDDPLRMYLSDIFTVTANLAGIPGLSVPAGFFKEFPVGIQILGPQFSEELLFQVGFTLEQETKYYKQKPQL